MSLEFQFENEFEVTARLQGITPAIISELSAAIDLLSPELAAFVIEQKLSGQVLNKVTGKLQESVHSEPTETSGDTITGTVTQDSAIASYGFIHEYGGDIPARFGSPMRWIGREGTPIFRTFARGFTLPERSFMRSALEDFAPYVEESLILAVARGIGEQ